MYIIFYHIIWIYIKYIYIIWYYLLQPCTASAYCFTLQIGRVFRTCLFISSVEL